MNKKHKIALVVDSKDWAFDIGAKLIVEQLQEYFDFKIVYEKEEYGNDLFQILNDLKYYDIIHFFWRKTLLQFDTDYFKRKLIKNNIKYNEYIQYFRNRISTGIHDHLFVDEENIRVFSNIFTKYVKQYYTISKKLQDTYNNISEYNKPWGVIFDTFDRNKFYPKNLLRFQNVNKPLVIGWVGNSNWNIKYCDFKGFNSILKPVVKELINEGYNIIPNYADKNIVLRTNDEMPDYYKTIDICICTSIEEGTPRIIIESMGCGVPIITTDVGITNEILGDNQKKYIIGCRNNGKDDELIRNRLKEKIKYLYNNRKELEILSNENIEKARLLDSTNYKDIYLKYFKDFLS